MGMDDVKKELDKLIEMKRRDLEQTKKHQEDIHREYTSYRENDDYNRTLKRTDDELWRNLKDKEQELRELERKRDKLFD
jgi:hypothetical protein